MHSMTGRFPFYLRQGSSRATYPLATDKLIRSWTPFPGACWPCPTAIKPYCSTTGSSEGDGWHHSAFSRMNLCEPLPIVVLTRHRLSSIILASFTFVQVTRSVDIWATTLAGSQGHGLPWSCSQRGSVLKRSDQKVRSRGSPSSAYVATGARSRFGSLKTGRVGFRPRQNFKRFDSPSFPGLLSGPAAAGSNAGKDIAHWS